MIRVACVLRSGGDYHREYVERLAEGVRRNLHTDYFFECLTDTAAVGHDTELLHSWPGWWSKVELFRHPEPTLYFDLDTVIQGDITPLADLVLGMPGEFFMLRDLGCRNRYASGAMAWSGGFRYLYEEFDPQISPPKYQTAALWGDGGYIVDKLRQRPIALQDLLPRKFASYKLSSLDEKRAASVVCYHGKPRPHEVAWRVL